MSTDIMIEFKGSIDNIETIEDAVNIALTIEQQGHEFFDIMASFEHGHLELIDGFIDAVTQFRMET